jgi:hypothetical protein
MKNLLPRGVSNVFFLLAMLGIVCCEAQDNVWTGAASGKWQDAAWSLGAIPASNHTVWITNYGWKAVEINATTAQNFPGSLTVNSIAISSPTNSFNTLLLNHAGAGTPLTVKALTVASNSAVAMESSALQINGPNGSGMMIGGRFDQNDSVVAGNQINVGYIGSGVYNFNSGYFTVSHLWLGGDYPGVFVQNGGTNGFGITHLDGNGKYVLSNGYYGAEIYFDFGQFLQQGGLMVSDLTLYFGSYVLAGGIHQGGATVPSFAGWSQGGASMLQTGGTNYGSLDIGSYGHGSYTLSNGVCYAENVYLGHGGSYFQAGGNQVIASGISIDEAQVNRGGGYEFGSLTLAGGQMSSSGIYSRGYYTQTGGTNFVSGDVTIATTEDTKLSVSGGLLTANNLTISPAYVGGASITGGKVIVTNTLSIYGISSFPFWRGFACDGQLVVSNIWLGPNALFMCGNGIINQSGTLTLTDASLYSGTNSVQLGKLLLANDGNTNSTLYLVSPTSIINFADSSSLTWSNEPVLMVEGWTGSLSGGGAQRIIFGDNSSALTGPQLAQIQFHNPAGLAEGTYPARILASGEIVPTASAPAPVHMALSPQPGGMRVTLQGEPGRTYCIEVSTDLVHWSPWTNQVNTNGTMTITDADAANYPARFYRARPVP